MTVLISRSKARMSAADEKLEIVSSGAAITLLGVPGSPGQDDPCGGLLPGSPAFRVSVYGDFRSG
jgi:hypothetical protein